MVSEKAEVDRVFRALASDVRRGMLDALRIAPLSVGDLAERFPALSRFAVMQHLKVLTSANLVVSRKTGRERMNYLNVVPIQLVYERWVRGYEPLWASTLTTIKAASEDGGVVSAFNNDTMDLRRERRGEPGERERG